MRSHFLILFFLFSLASAAQRDQSNPFLNDANGRPLYWGANYVSEGSPFFLDQYNTAIILLANGETYSEVKVKYNIQEHWVQYQTEDGKEMMSLSAIKKIYFGPMVLPDGVFENVTLETVNGLLNDKKADVYQVLDSGRISWMRKLDVTYRDIQRYSEATITRQFVRTETDYIRKPDGSLVKMEKTREFITALMSDQQQEINTWLDQHVISFKKTQDLLGLIRYYNSLF